MNNILKMARKMVKNFEYQGFEELDEVVGDVSAHLNLIEFLKLLS